MPANMKTKLSSSCSREGNGLQPCWQSSKISKNSDLEVKISAEAAHDTSRQSQEDVFSSSVISGWDIECVEDIDLEDLLAGPTVQFQHSPLFTFGSSFVGRLGSLPSTCPSILETIFSPFLELDEVPRNMIVLNCEGTNDKHPDMATTDIDNGHSENQTCNIWDFNISDMGIAGLSFDENVGLDDIVMRNLSLDFQCVGPDLMFDMADGYMILPFLEESMETSNSHEGELVEEVAVSPDDACLYMAIQQLKPSDHEMDFDCHSPDMDAFDPHLFLRNFPDLSEVVPSVWPNLLPKETRTRKPVTLVLDLDETLVHSTLDYSEDADFTFLVYFNMEDHTVYVRQRPHLQIFLERVAEMFEIIVFTASQSIYAEQLLDILDPEQRLISRRVFRESCIFSEGSYMKDLTVLELDLAKVAIIDNSPQVFRLQVNNGIPIQSWFDDPSDCALVSLIPFLETLADADDVRPIIAKRFNNKE